MFSEAATLSNGFIKRLAGRVTMRVSATVYAEGRSRRARVGNMSPFGAMVESDFVPVIGSSVSIRRGRLLVTGQAVWAKNGRFGLSFSHPAEVRDWLSAPKNPAQRAADGAFWALGMEESDSDLALGGDGAEDHQTNPLAEVSEVIRLMADLGDRLAEDLTVVGQHGQVLQNLDAAMQILQRIPADCAAAAIPSAGAG